MFRFYVECFGKMLWTIIAACLITIGIQYVVGTGGWILFFIKGMISAVIYCILIWFGALNVQEKELMTQPLKVLSGKMKRK